jgi:hypothetical protein
MENPIEEVRPPEDSWFQRALERRQAEIDGELVIQGARFNSYI